MKGFSIVIVTWNGLHHLKRFFPSVAATNYPDFEIIIADNNSTDGSKEWIKEHYPDVKIAAFDDNYGYTGGNNRAVPFAEKEILLFLNNDVEVTPDWLIGISTAFEADDEVAIVQPKLLSVEQPEYFEYAGAAGGYLDMLGYPFCRGRVLDTVEKDVGQYDDETEIVWASGAAFAIRKEIFTTLGGFDEDFEFHMEEIDLCWRIQNSGYKIRYNNTTEVFHANASTLNQNNPRKTFLNYRNKLFMITKNSQNNLFFLLIEKIFIDALISIFILFSKGFNHFFAIIKAYFSFYKHINLLLEFRKNEKREIKHYKIRSIICEYLFYKR